MRALAPLLLWFALSPGTSLADPPRIVLEEIPVPAHAPKPEITIYVSRQDLHPELDDALDESFVPKIVQSADQLPGSRPTPTPISGR